MTDDTVRRIRRIRGREPVKTRERITRALGETTRAEFVLFMMLKELDGEVRYDQVAVWGESGLCEHWGALVGRRAFRGGYDVRAPKDRYRNRFESLRESHLCRRMRERLPVWRACYAPHDISSQLRGLVYDNDGMLLGTIALMRREGRTFTPREQEELDRAIEPLEGILAEISETPTAAGYVLVDVNGRVEATSREIGPSQEAVARKAVAEHGMDRRVDVVIDEHAVTVTPVNGSGGVRYLVAMESSEAVTLKPALVLTPRQREVARQLVTDRTYDAIARELGVSTNTVKYHARGIYRRLGVRDRIELAVELTGSELCEDSH